MDYHEMCIWKQRTDEWVREERKQHVLGMMTDTRSPNSDLCSTIGKDSENLNRFLLTVSRVGLLPWNQKQRLQSLSVSYVLNEYRHVCVS